ncbi:hypothetical protein TrLO_g330 [Triparma laevis f. longispina]|uniref:Uncharacterized protein n=1 Tax=Triparma laevis f. longispina TaxID=1714387 RepID=A0A9W7EJ36_9STRA|nr:hypothetical protein TrLO_g330 [Triparma laevis f. longispina]
MLYQKEEELETMTLPNPRSTAAKALTLILSSGTIVLRGLQFGQTLLTFSAQVEVSETRKGEAILATLSTGVSAAKPDIDSMASRKGTKKKKVGSAGGAGGKADKLFCEIGALLYERFKKEAVIDERRKEDFIKNIDNAPALTEDEQKLIAGSMKLVEEVSSKAKRVTGTANESVKKYLHKPEGGGAAWGISVARMDVPAKTLFADSWLINTYARKAESKEKIREVWDNLDGTRGTQYIGSLRLPGIQDRFFSTWLTWEKLVDEAGLQTIIIAISPMVEYRGATCHMINGTDKMV